MFVLIAYLLYCILGIAGLFFFLYINLMLAAGIMTILNFHLIEEYESIVFSSLLLSCIVITTYGIYILSVILIYI